MLLLVFISFDEKRIAN